MPELALIIALKVVFVGLLWVILVLTDRPFVSAVVYTLVKMGTLLLLSQLDHTPANNTDDAYFATVYTILAVLNLFGSVLVAGVYCKYRFEPWVYWVCLILAIPLLFV